MFLVAFDLPLAILAFFLPLLSIHRQMVAQQDEDENDYGDRMAQLEKKLRSLLDKGALAEAQDAKNEIEIVRALHPDNRNYPTWPFNIRFLATISTVMILHIISFATLLVEKWDTVVNILNKFSGHS